jgi:hypothetical protein
MLVAIVSRLVFGIASYNSDTIVIDVSLVVELLLQLGVLLVRTEGVLVNRQAQILVSWNTYVTPVGWREVLLTLLGSTARGSVLCLELV